SPIQDNEVLTYTIGYYYLNDQEGK
ncbi:staphylobilin-forming heme oxygenase IsdG, partial [Staphylococcus simulans]